MDRMIANVYVKHGRKTLWVNEYMRQILRGKSEREAVQKAIVRKS